MNTNTSDSEITGKLEPEVAKAIGKRTPAKKAKLTNKAARAKKAVGKPAAERSNKKAEVIAMMRRAKGATLAEIMKATGLAASYGTGLDSTLGSKGKQIQSSKNAARRTDVQAREIDFSNSSPSPRGPLQTLYTLVCFLPFLRL